MNYFYQFGKHIRIVAIATTVALFPLFAPFAGLIAVIYIFSTLGDIKALNYRLSNVNLYSFQRSYIRGFMYKLISVIFVIGGAIVLGINLSTESVAHDFMDVGLPITIIIMITGIILFIVGSTVESRAWENLKLYFMMETSLFPEATRQALIEGCEYLRKGALIWALGIFIIPAIIGWIIQASGFLKLAKLDNMTYNEPTEHYATKSSYEIQPVPLIVATQSETDNIGINLYCPYCGSKVSEEAKFCLVCGSQIN
jgi:hypothetical protein